ncbi:MAG: PQQ-binding-like beta-propeller repeat protein [Candidatus Omnitrophica bacterium]|nr:PQQ-binding-like beta-propeller repeat protein [Candidatus Omnitrophota bacterium]
MFKQPLQNLLAISAILLSTAWASPTTAEVNGWLNWRGPLQTGESLEKGLPDTLELNGENHLWTKDLKGRGEPLIVSSDGEERVYAWGYRGEGPDLREYLVCLDPVSGETIWEEGFNDFLSDNVYDRYTIGSPGVDPETGNVYLLTTPGIFACFTPKGELLWQHSFMEEYGRLTFPNGRTGCPVIDGDLVIVRGITSNWGSDGPARDRFYAFNKVSGELVWTSTPGVGPHDSSFSTPIFGWENGRRVFYCGTGCGNIVCVNVKTGDPVWRYQFSRGGVNSTVVPDGQGNIIAIHGKENIDSTETGRMISLKTGAEPKEGESGPVVIDQSYENWRAPLMMFTSSPCIHDGKIYQTVHTGELVCVDSKSGKILWQEKLSADQIHASPIYADGKIYVGFPQGDFYILRPGETGAETLCHLKLEGACLGAPSIWNGRIYVFTTDHLYCFGSAKGGNPPQPPSEKSAPEPGPAAQLQIVPSEVLMRPGETVSFDIDSLDSKGFFVDDVDSAEWSKFIPPTAKVKVKMDAEFNDSGELVAGEDATISAGAYMAKSGDLKGTIRGRVLPELPIKEDFESFEIDVPDPNGEGKFAFPPLPWIGARFKWDIREMDGNKVLSKTLDNVLFQRAITFIGHPDESNYTVQADVMTDGNRRMKSNVGVINQRYFIALIGNAQQIEVSSNHNRLKVGVPFKWDAKKWYTLKTRVDVAPDGSGVVRAKAWPKGEDEPEGWNIEVPHKHAHAQGAPGLFGFALQSRFKVFVDNVVVTPNE